MSTGESRKPIQSRMGTKRSFQFDCKDETDIKVKRPKETVVTGVNKQADKSGKPGKFRLGQSLMTFGFVPLVKWRMEISMTLSRLRQARTGFDVQDVKTQ